MRNELNYLRVILVVLIITTHLLTQYAINTNPDANQIGVLYWIRNIFIVATPGFIILSELLTTLNYKDKLPQGYLWQRLKYILVPYIIIGVFFSFIEVSYGGSTFMEIFTDNVLLGNWHGYFVIVIMQFFLLNYIIYKINPKILSSKTMLVLSFIVNFAFLYSHYNFDPVWNFTNDIYPLNNATFILGWIFFYFLGGYIGANYDSVKKFAENQIAIIVLMLIISYAVFVVLSRGDYYTVTSFDYALILFHTFSFLFIIYLSTQLVDTAPNIFSLISSFSYFIFLFHPVIIPGIYSITSVFADMTVIFVALSLLLSLGMCIGVGLILKQFGVFKYVIGRQPYK